MRSIARLSLSLALGAILVAAIASPAQATTTPAKPELIAYTYSGTVENVVYTGTGTSPVKDGDTLSGTLTYQYNSPAPTGMLVGTGYSEYTFTGSAATHSLLLTDATTGTTIDQTTSTSTFIINAFANSIVVNASTANGATVSLTIPLTTSLGQNFPIPTLASYFSTPLVGASLTYDPNGLTFDVPILTITSVVNPQPEPASIVTAAIAFVGTLSYAARRRNRMRQIAA